MPFKKQVTDDEIAKIVPSLDELNGAGKGLDITNAEHRDRIKDLVLKSSQVIDEIEDAAIILEIPKLWITSRCMSDWNKGKALMRAHLVRSQILASMRGQPVSQIWLGKQRLGQSDRPAQEKYLNKRYNTGSDLEDAKDKLAKAFGKPTEKKRKRKVA